MKICLIIIAAAEIIRIIMDVYTGIAATHNLRHTSKQQDEAVSIAEKNYSLTKENNDTMKNVIHVINVLQSHNNTLSENIKIINERLDKIEGKNKPKKNVPNTKKLPQNKKVSEETNNGNK